MLLWAAGCTVDGPTDILVRFKHQEREIAPSKEERKTYLQVER
jgi:hypothetical protein